MPLIDRYPEWYRDSAEFTALQAAYDALASERSEIWADILAQCNLDTATWGLAIWEDRLSLITDERIATDIRRAKIRARLQGGGIANAAALSGLASSVIGETVNVTEHNTGSWLELTWGHPGYPAAFREMMAALYEVVPAHLEPLLVPYYASWADFHAGLLTMGELDSMTWTQAHHYEPNI